MATHLDWTVAGGGRLEAGLGGRGGGFPESLPPTPATLPALAEEMGVAMGWGCGCGFGGMGGGGPPDDLAKPITGDPLSRPEDCCGCGCWLVRGGALEGAATEA